MHSCVNACGHAFMHGYTMCISTVRIGVMYVVVVKAQPIYMYNLCTRINLFRNAAALVNYSVFCGAYDDKSSIICPLPFTLNS